MDRIYLFSNINCWNADRSTGTFIELGLYFGDGRAYLAGNICVYLHYYPCLRDNFQCIEANEIMDYILQLRQYIGHRAIQVVGATVLIVDAEGRLLLLKRSEIGRAH